MLTERWFDDDPGPWHHQPPPPPSLWGRIRWSVVFLGLPLMMYQAVALVGETSDFDLARLRIDAGQRVADMKAAAQARRERLSVVNSARAQDTPPPVVAADPPAKPAAAGCRSELVALNLCKDAP